MDEITPPDFESVDNQLDIYSLVAMYPYLGERVLTGGDAISPGGGTQSHLGATRPRVGIVKLGLDAPTWQYNDESGTRFVFACQGIEPCQANADAGTRLLKKAPM